MKADFHAGLQSKLENSDWLVDPSPEIWDQLKTVILQTVLGFSIKKNNENKQEIQEMLAKKR